MANYANQPTALQQAGPVPAGFRFPVEEMIRSQAAPNIIHGRGVVTSVEIPQGALILEEAPFVRLGSHEFNIPQSARSHLRWQMLSAWSPASVHGIHYDKFKANALRCGRFRIPNTATEVDASGLFLLASWLNSSCAPNIHAHWNEQTRRMQFRAIRRIPAGEELCICYDVKALLFARSDRQRKLHDRYGFSCRCPVCSEVDGGKIVHSDRRRCDHREIVERGLRSIENPQEAVGKIEDAIRGLREDGVYHFSDTLHYDLYQALWQAEDFNNAMLCLLTARNLTCTMVGRDDHRVGDMTATLPLDLRDDYRSDCRAPCCNLL